MAKKSTPKTISNDLLSALCMLVIGVLLIVLKTSAISIAMTVFGVYLIYKGIVTILAKDLVKGLIMLVIGIALITCGWLFVAVALYVLAAVLLVNGISDILALVKKGGKPKAIEYISPVLMTVAGILLIFAQGETLSWMFIVVGALVIVKAVLMLLKSIKK